MSDSLVALSAKAKKSAINIPDKVSELSLTMDAGSGGNRVQLGDRKLKA